MMQVLSLFGILLFGFVLRLLFAAKPSKDHICALWDIKRQSNSPWVTTKVTDTFLNGDFFYPVLVHWIISRFPEEKWTPVGRIITLLTDMVTAVVVYVTTTLLVSGTTGTMQESLPLLATLIFVTMPVLLPWNARVKAISGRTFGLTCTTLYFFILYFCLQGLTATNVIASFLMFAIIVLSSTFALQTVIIFSLLLTPLTHSTVPLLLCITYLLICFLLPKQFGTKQPLVYFYDHTIWYLRNWKTSPTPASRAPMWKQLLMPYYFVFDRKELSRMFKGENTLIIAAYSVPGIIVFYAWYFFVPAFRLELFATSFNLYMWHITLVSTISFLLTSLRSLLFLGQSERYFEYSAPFFCALFVAAGYTSGVLSFQIVILLLLLHVSISLGRIHPDTLQKVFGKLDVHQDLSLVFDAIDYLAKSKKEVRVATIPVKYSSFFSAAGTSKKYDHIKYYFGQLNIVGERNLHYMERDLAAPAVFNGLPKDLIKKYKVTHILYNNRYAQNTPFPFVKELIKMKTVYKNKNYSIVKLS